MTTRRVRVSTRCQVQHRITAEAIAAFRAGAWLELHRALGLRPWQVSPLDATGACPWPPSCGAHESWALAHGLRAELETTA